jgi:hypothetical protein
MGGAVLGIRVSLFFGIYPVDILHSPCVTIFLAKNHTALPRVHVFEQVAYHFEIEFDSSSSDPEAP